MPRPPARQTAQLELARLRTPLLVWLDCCLGTAVGQNPLRLLRPAGWSASSQIRNVPPVATAAAAAIVLGFCPGLGLGSAVHHHFAAWLTLHVEGVIALGRPRRWMWCTAIAVMLLEAACASDILAYDDELAREFYRDTLLSPALYWAFPFTVWREGGRGSAAGSALPGMFARELDLGDRPPGSFVTLSPFLDDCLAGLVYWGWEKAPFRPSSLPRRPSTRGRRNGAPHEHHQRRRDHRAATPMASRPLGDAPWCSTHEADEDLGCAYCKAVCACLSKLGSHPAGHQANPRALGLSSLRAPGQEDWGAARATASTARPAEGRPPQLPLATMYDLAFEHRGPETPTHPTPGPRTSQHAGTNPTGATPCRGVPEPAPEPAETPQEARQPLRYEQAMSTRSAIDSASGHQYWWDVFADNTISATRWTPQESAVGPA